MEYEVHAAEVQKKLHNRLAYAVNRRKFMRDVFDFHRSDSGTRKG